MNKDKNESIIKNSPVYLPRKFDHKGRNMHIATLQCKLESKFFLLLFPACIYISSLNWGIFYFIPFIYKQKRIDFKL